MSNRLYWEPTMDYVDFVTHVSTAVQHHFITEAATATLYLDDSFWEKFCALSDDEAGHGLDVLQTVSIRKVSFFFLYLSNHGSNLTATEARAAFHRLCDALGSIGTITSASVDIENDVLNLGMRSEL
jgi:hypothetical protein